MEALLATLEASAVASVLRASRWGYALISAAHVLGIALLVGSAAPLALRLAGLWRSIPLAHVVPILSRVAAAGLVLAIVTGSLLFAVRASEYASIGVFKLKLLLILAATLSALTAHHRYGTNLEGGGPRSLRLHGALSIACWMGALLCGRLIAFASG